MGIYTAATTTTASQLQIPPFRVEIERIVLALVKITKVTALAKRLMVMMLFWSAIIKSSMEINIVYIKQFDNTYKIESW